MNLYMNFELLMAVVITIGTVYLLVRQYETRTVLIGAGFFLCIIALKPLMALDAFVKAMTTAGLIQNICAAMGFAYVMKLTQVRHAPGQAVAEAAEELRLHAHSRDVRADIPHQHRHPLRRRLRCRGRGDDDPDADGRRGAPGDGGGCRLRRHLRLDRQPRPVAYRIDRRHDRQDHPGGHHRRRRLRFRRRRDRAGRSAADGAGLRRLPQGRVRRGRRRPRRRRRCRSRRRPRRAVGQARGRSDPHQRVLRAWRRSCRWRS